jgi:hypothetical protein
LLYFADLLSTTYLHRTISDHDENDDMDIFGDENQMDLKLFEDCLLDLEPELHNETHIMMHDDAFMDAANSISEPLYARGGAGGPHIKRVVRFLEDQDGSEPSLDMGMGGGELLLATGGMAATAGLLLQEENEDSLHLEEQDLDSSIGMLDVFGEEASESYSQDHDASGTSMMEKGDGDDDSQNSIDEEEEKEKQIRKTLIMTVFGVGFLGLVGFGSKKLMNMLNRGNNDQDLGAGDIVGDSIDTATHAADVVDIGGHIAQGTVSGSSSSSQAAAAQASFNASANASQSGNSFVMGGVGNNPGAMTGAQ